jgi:hypothetical protein
MSPDLTQFTRRITITPQQGLGIYEHWAIPLAIEQWFLLSAEYTGPQGAPKSDETPATEGDKYLWRWHGYPADVVETGTVIHANGVDRFGFTFTNGSLVNVSIRDEQGVAVVELQQTEIHDPNVYIECGYSWAFYLTNLKSILEGGIDLRNKDPRITNVINA